MEKLFTSGHSPFMLLVAALIISLSVETNALQQITAAVAITGLAVGMTKQVIMQYRLRKVGIHWVLNTMMFFAVALRTVYLVRTGQLWLAIPDAYATLMAGAIQLQLAGHLLKKLPESE